MARERRLKQLKKTQEVPLADQLSRRVMKLSAILEVAKEMTVQRDLDKLLRMIMEEASKVVEADRCSIFIVDRDRHELWTKVAQGTSTIRIPMGTGIAGHVAETGKAINIPDAYADPRHNRKVDEETGYRTRNMLCVPMVGPHGEVVGVLEALNKIAGPFEAEDEELLMALGGQAASAIENALLHEEINRLFEGFVRASVVAIESRDPTTAGHSGRVADLTIGLAEALEHAATGPYAGTRFSREEIREIRFASLLHDFGKVGVREPVLIKAQKLYPYETEALDARFQLMRARFEAESYRRSAEIATRGGAEAQAGLEAEQLRLAQFRKELEEIWGFLMTCNRPTVLAQGGFERLNELARRSFPDGNGGTLPMLTEREVRVLAIPRGSLSEEERKEIESHVTWTYRFLSTIPWTRALRRVPDIAYAHHEKLDGRGYPRALSAPNIPVQSRMMAISDIYDALTASDRPYKKAVPHVSALDILGREAREGQLDTELLQVFTDAKIFERVMAKKR